MISNTDYMYTCISCQMVISALEDVTLCTGALVEGQSGKPH